MTQNITFVNASQPLTGLPSNNVRLANRLISGRSSSMSYLTQMLGTTPRGVRARISDLRGRGFLITNRNGTVTFHGIEV